MGCNCRQPSHCTACMQVCTDSKHRAVRHELVITDGTAAAVPRLFALGETSSYGQGCTWERLELFWPCCNRSPLATPVSSLSFVCMYGCKPALRVPAWQRRVGPVEPKGLPFTAAQANLWVLPLVRDLFYYFVIVCCCQCVYLRSCHINQVSSSQVSRSCRIAAGGLPGWLCTTYRIYQGAGTLVVGGL